NAAAYWVDDFTLFEHAHRLAPNNSLALNNYAVEIAHRGLREPAIGMLQKLLSEHPKDFLPNFNMGRLLYEENFVCPAYHYLKVARSLQPDMPDAYLQLGLVCLKLDRQDEALVNFRTAAAIRPHDAKVHFALGVVWAQRKDCTLARAQFSEALSLDPSL